MPLNSALSLLPGGNLSVLQQKPSPPYAEGLIPSHVVRDMVTRPLLLLLYLHLTLNYWIFSTKLQASSFFSPTLKPLLAAQSCRQWSPFSSQNFLETFLMPCLPLDLLNHRVHGPLHAPQSTAIAIITATSALCITEAAPYLTLSKALGDLRA